MNSLELRKQLLVAESDLNRVQLAQEWQTVAEDVRSVAHRIRSFGSLAVSAASVISGLMALRKTKSAERRSWWGTMLKGAEWAALLWAAFSPRPKS
jgi:hypothetical protein